MAEMQPSTAERPAQDALQVGAMDAKIGRPALPLLAQLEMDVMRGDPLARSPIAVDQLGRFG